MCIEEIAEITNMDRHDKCLITTSANTSCRSTKSSHSDSGHGWHEGGMARGMEVPGM